MERLLAYEHDCTSHGDAYIQFQRLQWINTVSFAQDTEASRE
jgi:hypothetical protein